MFIIPYFDINPSNISAFPKILFSRQLTQVHTGTASILKTFFAALHIGIVSRLNVQNKLFKPFLKKKSSFWIM